MNPAIPCYLDRFEGESAVLLIYGREVAVPSSVLPDGAREGDHLQLTMIIDDDARQRTETEVSDLQERLKLQDQDR